MNNLIKLELRRNHLKVYNTAVLIIMVIMLAFQYLIAAIPKMDPTDTDVEMFLSYPSLINLNLIITMSIFTILSAVMASKFVIEDYTGKKALLLFSYPIPRRKILDAKLFMVFAYTAVSMLISGIIILSIFLFTESLFPLCPDAITLPLIISSLLSLLLYSLMSGLLGILSLWFGFLKKSITAAIVSGCIIIMLIGQALTASLYLPLLKYGIFAAAFIFALPAIKSLHLQVQKMEI